MTKLQNNSALETVQASFNFEIDKFPLFGPENMKTPVYGLFRSDNGEFIGKPCAKGYVPHQTEDVLALVESAGEVFEGATDVRCYFKNAHYVSVAPTKDLRKQIYGTKDNIFPRFIIRGGYDGRGFQATMGFYRDACANMAWMRQVEGTTVSIRHNCNLRENMDELIDQFSNLNESWEILANTIESLENQKVRLANFLSQVYTPPAADASSKKVEKYKKQIEEIFRRVQLERIKTDRPNMNSDYEVSAWEAFNSVQGYHQHKTRKGTTDFSRIISASSTNSFVRKAESVALSLIA